MKQLIEGIKKFRTDVFPEHSGLFSKLASGQTPQALFITCADSRIVPDLITQTKPGDLFICRTVGNLIPPHGQGDGGVACAIEYAVTALKVSNVIVCGHSDCGAMKALLHPEATESLPQTRSWLRYGEAAREVVHGSGLAISDAEQLSALVEENVVTQLEHLKTHPSVAARLARGNLQLYGLVYSIHTGEIASYDSALERFIPVDGRLASATPKLRLMARKEVA
ncbi:MAG: carbonic anhydrase [Bryobacteraceae bacterium]